MSKYFQMVIEFEVPDDVTIKDLKNHINSWVDESIKNDRGIHFVSTIKPSAKVEFDRAKWREEERAKLKARGNK